MKFTERPKWKRIALAALCLIGLLAAVGGSFGAYTSQNFQRGVARNRDGESVRFTSNYLQGCSYSATTESKAYAERTVLFSESEESKTLSIDIFVYNYAGSTTMVNQRDITYDMEISFEGGTGNGYGVTMTTDTGEAGAAPVQNGTKYTFGGMSFPGIIAKAHKYTVTFSSDNLDKVNIIAVARPTNSSVTNNQMLAAVIKPGAGAKTQLFTKKGEFTDDTSKPLDSYNGFNYEISISSGKANATLVWDTDVVEIDEFFLKTIGKENEMAKILKDGKVEFVMDQSNGTGEYLIPFYIKDKNKMPSSWDDVKKADGTVEEIGMKNRITFEADPITE